MNLNTILQKIIYCATLRVAHFIHLAGKAYLWPIMYCMIFFDAPQTSTCTILYTFIQRKHKYVLRFHKHLSNCNPFFGSWYHAEVPFEHVCPQLCWHTRTTKKYFVCREDWTSLGSRRRRCIWCSSLGRVGSGWLGAGNHWFVLFRKIKKLS